MNSILKTISYLGLAITIAAPLLVWAGKLSIEANKTLLIVGMLVWFGSAVFWIKREKTEG